MTRKLRKIIKIIPLILLITSTATATLTREEAADEAMKYVEAIEGENLDLNPSQRVEFGGDEYWVFDVKKHGRREFMLPINAETGEVAEQEARETIVRIQYVAGSFEAEDIGIEDYLSSTLNFAIDIKSEFTEQKEELELFTEGSLEGNISMEEALPSKAALEKSLEETIDIAEELQSTIIETESILGNINSPMDPTSAYQSIHQVFNLQESLADTLGEIRPIANQFNSELSEAYDNGWVDLEDRLDLEDAADAVIIRQRKIENIKTDLIRNRDNINEFFDHTIDERVASFTSKLNERLEISEEEKERNEIIGQLSQYSEDLENITNKASEEVPGSYLTDQGFKALEDNVIEKIQQAREKCEPEKDIEEIEMEECREAENKYSEIEDILVEMQEVINEYEKECQPGETRECTTNGEQGIQRCGSDGLWKECEPIETRDTNWTVIGGLSAVLVGLILYKFKDKFKTEDKKHERKTEDVEDLWR